MRVSGEDSDMMTVRKKLPAWSMRDQIRDLIRQNQVLRDRNLPIHKNPVCYPRQNDVIYLYFEYF